MRQHEYEMPDAVVHGGTQRDGRGDGQQRGHCDQQKNGTSVQGDAGCERRKHGSGRAAKSENGQDNRQLERQQRRNVSARHVRNGNQLAVE